MNLLQISIYSIILSSCYSHNSAERNHPKKINHSVAKDAIPKTPSEFLNQVESASEAEYKSGDTIKYVLGDLFKTNEKFALITYKRRFDGAVYQLYKFSQKKWELLIDDVAETDEDMNYRIEDFDFDGTLDFAYLNVVNMNGNEWYRLYTKQPHSFKILHSFENVSNPIIDPKAHLIKSQYFAGNYDQHSKTIYQFQNGQFQVRETVTIDPVFDQSNEVIGHTVCYSKLLNNKLKTIFKKTNPQDFSFDLYEKTIPMG
ncbi:MAG: hypothetical protein HYZ43_16220 [Flavobacteriia bacterium]|nr:hypothetical protein [Flavobacteriia bacterium]